MIRAGFLSAVDRADLIALARDGSAASRMTRRANALVLLDAGWSCQEVAKALLFDDDTIGKWHGLFVEDGLEGLTRFEAGGSACQLSSEQQEQLKAWVTVALPRTTRQIGAWIEREFGVAFEGRSGLIALLNRLGLEYHKAEVIPRKLDEDKQKAFIASYENLLNSLGDDEAVLFGDAVHPTHAARPVSCWAPKQDNLAIEQTSGRQRINIHGAIDLQTGQTRMIEAETIDAMSTVRLLESIEALYPLLAYIHLFLDNARYHHAKLVRECPNWARPVLCGGRSEMSVSTANATLLRARRETSSPSTRPTWASATSAVSRAKPDRATKPEPESPRSSSMTTMRSAGQPSSRALSARQRSYSKRSPERRVRHRGPQESPHF